MGIDQTVIFPSEQAAPDWSTVRDWLTQRGLSVRMKLIDGEIALPDEQPPPDWAEIRVGGPEGMVSLGRQGERVQLTVWSEPAAELRRLWNALTLGFAIVGGGRVIRPDGEEMDPQRFTEAAELPQSMHADD
jgi:hypothetical protein